MDRVRDNHILLKVFNHLNNRKRHQIIKYNKKIKKRLSFKVNKIRISIINNKLTLKEIFEK